MGWFLSLMDAKGRGSLFSRFNTVPETTLFSCEVKRSVPAKKQISKLKNELKCINEIYNSTNQAFDCYTLCNIHFMNGFAWFTPFLQAKKSHCPVQDSPGRKHSNKYCPFWWYRQRWKAKSQNYGRSTCFWLLWSCLLSWVQIRCGNFYATCCWYLWSGSCCLHLLYC